MTTWTGSLIQQFTLQAELESALSTIEGRLYSTVVRSFYEPTRQEWESAYVQQTGRLLPIPVGAKLVWINLNRGVACNYSTAYDLNSGLESSGEVYPVLDNNYPKEAFRLVGSMLPYPSILVPGTTGIGTLYHPNEGLQVVFGINQLLNQIRGARTCMLFFSLRSNNNAPYDNLMFRISGAQNNVWGGSDFEGFSGWFTGGGVLTGVETDALTTGYVQLIADAVPTISSTDGMFLNGCITFHGTALRMVQNQEAKQPILMGQIQAYGSLGVLSGANNQKLVHGSFMGLNGTGLAKDAWHLATNSGGTINDGYFTPDSRAWLYALYENDPQYPTEF